MSRLTKKRKDGLYDNSYGVCDEEACKLGQLEDIEEELGIDLITLFKAMKQGIYYKEEVWGKMFSGFSSIIYLSLKDKCLMEECDDGSIHDSIYYHNYYFKDYGKTWALTKEELI